MNRRVAVIGGGTSNEHDVSLGSAAGVAAALAEAGWEPVRLTIGRDGGWLDETGATACLGAAVEALRSCAAVFPTVHGSLGEDGTLAALCELAAVRYVGSGVRAGALAMDKWATKRVAAAVGVRTAPGVVVTAQDAGRPFPGPLVVKPVSGGSSFGVTLVGEGEDLAPALAAAFAFDDRVVVESFVTGREIDVAVLGHGTERVVAPVLEILGEGIFDTAAKYESAPSFQIPAALGSAERRALETAAVAVYDALGCEGVARVDFFLTADGPVLNEVNTAPGFTEHSQVPQMFAAAGVSYPELVDRLVREALR